MLAENARNTGSVLGAPFETVLVSGIVILDEMESTRPLKMTPVRNPKDSTAVPRAVVAILKGHCGENGKKSPLLFSVLRKEPF